MDRLKIAFLGDIMPGGLLTYEGHVSKEIIDYLNTFDLRVATCETAFGDGSSLCRFKMSHPKLGTVMYSLDEGIQLFKELNIDAVSIANNHSCDCNIEGLYHMIDLLNENGIRWFGAGHNLEEASRPAVINVKGKTVCLLGYLYEYPWFYFQPAYIPTETEGGIRRFDIKEVIQDVQKYKELFDYVFVMPHWGTEHTQWPNMNEVGYARSIIDAGADGVIGSHTHTVQPIWKYKGKMLCMSLGNFIFPDRYINKPRISYYPSKEEIQSSDIPVLSGFPYVDRLSIKKVSDLDRRGIICAVSMLDNKTSYTTRYTYLTHRHQLVFDKHVSTAYKLKMEFIKTLFLDKHYIAFRIYRKLKTLIKRFK